MLAQQFIRFLSFISNAVFLTRSNDSIASLERHALPSSADILHFLDDIPASISSPTSAADFLRQLQITTPTTQAKMASLAVLSVSSQTYFFNLMRLFVQDFDKLDSSATTSYSMQTLLALFTWSLAYNHYNLHSKVTAERAALIAHRALFEKVSQLTSVQISQHFKDDIGTSIQTEVTALKLGITSIFESFHDALALLAASSLLISTMGVSSVYGVALLLLIIPTVTLINSLLKKVSLKTDEYAAETCRQLSEFLNAIGFLKMSSWTNAFSDLIMQTRSRQESALASYLYRSVGVRAMTFSMVLLPKVVTQVAYTSESSTYPPSFAVMASLVESVVAISALTLPSNISNSIDGYQTLLSMMELLSLETKSDTTTQGSNERSICLSNCTAKWNDTSNPDHSAFKLHFRNFSIPRGSLVVISNSSGLGITSLLQTLMGQMHLELDADVPNVAPVIVPIPRGHRSSSAVHPVITSLDDSELDQYYDVEGAGHVAASNNSISLPSSYAFCSEKPWIFPGTVRENILINQSMDDEDLAQDARDIGLHLPMDTVIDEMSIANDQKKLIELLRVLQLKKEVYLFDNFMNSLEASTQQLIATYLIGFRSNCTRIIASDHQLLHEAATHKIVIDEEGNVEISLSTSMPIQMSRSAARHLMTPMPPTSFLSSQASVRAMTMKLLRQQAVFFHHQETMEFNMSRSLKEVFSSAHGCQLAIPALLTVAISQMSPLIADLWLINFNTLSRALSTSIYWTILSVFIVSFFLGYSSFCSTIVFGSQKATLELFGILLRSLPELDSDYLARYSTSSIVQRISRHLTRLDDNLDRAASNQIYLIGASIVSIIFAVTTLPMLSIAVFVPFPMYFLILRRYWISNLVVRDAQRKSRELIMSDQDAFFHGRLHMSFLDMKNFASQRMQDHLLAQSTIATSNYIVECWQNLRLEKFSFMSMTAVLLLLHRIRPHTSVAGFAITIIFELVNLLNSLGSNLPELQALLVSWEELHTISHNVALPSSSSAEGPGQIAAEGMDAAAVVFQNVELPSSQHTSSEFQHFNVRIPVGKKVAIVGSVGSGKSSIILTLMQSAKLSNGFILINGNDAGKMTMGELGRNLSVVPSQTIVFGNTMRFNLDPFSEHSDEALWSVLTLSGLKSLVEDWPDKLSTVVNGQMMTSSEKYLLGIARVLLQDRPIVIFDDTEAIGESTVSATVHNIINDQLRGKTIVMITHSTTSALDCDRVYVLKQGKVVEMGGPSELLSNDKGAFRLLHEQWTATR